MTDIGRSRRIWRRSFFVLLGVSVVLIAILFFSRTGGKVSYAGESQDALRADYSIVAQMLQEQQPAATRSAVLRVLRRESPKARILATDSTVSLGDLVFYFGKTGRLERVERAGNR